MACCGETPTLAAVSLLRAHLPGLAASAGHVRQLMADKRITCRAYTRQEGVDAPEITDWKWIA